MIVDWDRRGTDKSYAALEPTATLTFDQAISDTSELTTYLRQRFDEPKIYVVGESWGSILGVLAVQRQPELFYALIGSGQMVSLCKTDRRFYQDVLDFRRDVTCLAVPVYILDGAAELAARRDLTLEWVGALEAPTKRMFTLDNAAHAVAFEQFEAFGRIMRETVLPETDQGR